MMNNIFAKVKGPRKKPFLNWYQTTLCLTL
jgi:hypothetical protein